MKIFHQTGFRHNWNIESYKKGIGDGIIYSPVNIDADKLLKIEDKYKVTGFLDPQLYLLNEAKGTIDTYPYFPGNLKDDFSTSDMDASNVELSELCVNFQIANNFEYLVIPTRYFVDNPTNFLIQSKDFFISPFCDKISQKKINKKVLLSVIVKEISLIDEDKRNELLNWITSHLRINGVYLIFENNFKSKQIKDFEYLLNALQFIHTLKQNDLEVHIGYCNTEAFLYSVAMPDSVTIGSYENLRSFGIKRFQDTDKQPMRAPNARLYSTKLLQWIDYVYVQAMAKQIDNYEDYFDDSEYKPLMFNPDFNWHFAKPEPYKHYFFVFTSQLKSLPIEQKDRIDVVKESIKFALDNFKFIVNEHDVLLDDNSDGSHLATWYNVVSSFQKELN